MLKVFKESLAHMCLIDIHNLLGDNVGSSLPHQLAFIFRLMLFCWRISLFLNLDNSCETTWLNRITKNWQLVEWMILQESQPAVECYENISLDACSPECRAYLWLFVKPRMSFHLFLHYMHSSLKQSAAYVLLFLSLFSAIYLSLSLWLQRFLLTIIKYFTKKCCLHIN